MAPPGAPLQVRAATAAGNGAGRAGVPFAERRRRFDEAVPTLRQIVHQEPDPPPLWITSWGSPAGLRRHSRRGRPTDQLSPDGSGWRIPGFEGSRRSFYPGDDLGGAVADTLRTLASAGDRRDATRVAQAQRPGRLKASTDPGIAHDTSY